MSAAAITTGRIRRPGVRLLVVLAVAVLLLLPSAARSATVGGAGAAVPTGAWPLSPAPTVEHPFDPPDSAYGSGHRGVDLAGTVGAPVRAAMSGTVTFAGSLAGRGVVVVDHGDTRTTYEPVAATVAVGDAVAQGAVIGTLTGVQSHCLPSICLHWGWIRNADDVYLDPLGLIGLGHSVRLLPLWRAAPAARTGTPSPFAALPYGGWLPLIARLLG
ncbi:MAG: murein hydrolase activator EnvC family protein [Myxococcaceae bacterium]